MQLTDEQIAQLPEDAQKAYRELLKQNAALSSAVSGNGKFSLHRGDKGTVVVRGFGRFPHSFYVEQLDAFVSWIRGDGYKTIQAFKEANKGQLKTKVAAVVEGQQAPATK